MLNIGDIVIINKPTKGLNLNTRYKIYKIYRGIDGAYDFDDIFLEEVKGSFCEFDLIKIEEINMQQLTKSQIIELRARAIAKIVGLDYDNLLVEHNRICFYKQAEATIEADEKAGVLRLVEEGENRAEELIAFDNWYRTEYKVKPSRDCMFDPMHHQGFRAWLAGRANTPVYQVRKDDNN